MPQKQREDVTHHWLYTADIDPLPDGGCSTDDFDKVYEVGPTGAFTKLVGSNAPRISLGWSTAGGFRVPDTSYGTLVCSRPKTRSPNRSWHLKLGVMRKPKPVLQQ